MPKSNAGGPGRGSMGALGAPPGHVLGTLGAVLGTLGALLGALGDALGRSWAPLKCFLQKEEKNSHFLSPTWTPKWSQVGAKFY